VCVGTGVPVVPSFKSRNENAAPSVFRRERTAPSRIGRARVNKYPVVRVYYLFNWNERKRPNYLWTRQVDRRSTRSADRERTRKLTRYE